MTLYALNKKTNRTVKIGSPTYIRQKKLGMIVEYESGEDPYEKIVQDRIKEKEAEAKQAEEEKLPLAPPKLERQSAESVDVEFTAAQNAVLQKKVMETTTDIVAENKNEFVGLTQKQTDKLLKKMLYEKLCIGDKKKKKKKAPAKKKKKKPPTPPPSSSEESSVSSSEFSD